MFKSHHKKIEDNLDLEWWDRKNKEFRDLVCGYPAKPGPGFTIGQRQDILEKINPVSNYATRYSLNCERQNFLNIIISRIRNFR